MPYCIKCNSLIPDDWWEGGKGTCPSCKYNYSVCEYLPSLSDIRKIYEQMPHRKLEKKAEEKLKSIGYKIVSYDEIPRQIKDKLDGAPDICAVKNGEWVFVEVTVTGVAAKVGKYLRAGKVILVLPIDSAENLEVWGRQELELV